MGILLVNVYSYDPVNARTELRGFSTARWNGLISANDDEAVDYISPDWYAYSRRILDGGFIERHMFAPGTTIGRSELATGTFVLSNKDRLLDDWVTHSFDGQYIKFYWAEKYSTATPTLLATLTIEQMIPAWDTISFTLRDPMLNLDQAAITATFAGTNSGATGIEGSANDLKGKPKPFLYGLVRDMQPVMLNTTKLILGCNFDAAGATKAVTAISNVRLNYNSAAVVIDTAVGTSGDCANLAALQAATIASGKYATCLAEGLIRFNNLASGEIVTMDVTQGAASSDRTAAQICKNMIKDRLGLVDGDFVSASITALDTANSAVCGIYVDDSKTVLDACTEVLESVGGWLVTDEEGLYEFGRLTAPEDGTSVRTFLESDIIATDGALEAIQSNDAGSGIPPWKSITSAHRVWRTFTDTEFAGAVSIDDREYAKQQFRDVTDSDSAVLATYPTSPVLRITSLMDDLSAVATENTRQLTLRKAGQNNYPRMGWVVPIKEETIYNLGDVVTVDVNAFDMSGGKDFVITGYRLEFATRRVDYHVWG